MRNSSSINTYGCENGMRVSKLIINRNIRKAKEIKTQQFRKDYDCIYCEFTGQSGGTYIDIMHIISVDECQKSGRANLAWDQKNLRFGTRDIHNKHDKKTSKEREEIYIELNG